MGLLSLFRRDRRETRASGSGFTAQVIEARNAAITGRTGLGELTATVQGCASLWEGALSTADVQGTDALRPATLSLAARALAFRGEFVALIGDDRLIPASDWDTTTRDGEPRAYRLTIAEAGGGRSVTALAPEVLHVRIGSDPVTPWAGTPPLRRASLTAELLHAIEAALAETFRDAPLGSQVVPMPETSETDRDKLARSFRGQHGRVLLRESVTTTAAGGPAPQTDWRPSDLSPDLSRSEVAASLQAAREAILSVYGVLPSMLANNAAGPAIREGQRHLATWTLQPVAALIAQEATDKLGDEVTLDVLTPLQAYDAGGRARALKGTLDALAAAKAAGLSDDAIAAAAKFAGTPRQGAPMILADDLRFMLHDMLDLYGVPATLVRSTGGDPWGTPPGGETTRDVRVILSSFDEGVWRDKLIAEVAAEGLDPAPVAGDTLRLEGDDWPVKVVWPQHAPGGGTPLSYRLELER